MAESIVQRIFEHADETPDKVALIDGTEKITFAQLRNTIFGVRSLLLRNGIGPSDRVVVRTAKSVATVYAYFAAQLLGAIPVPIDPGMPDEKRALILSLAGTNHIIWNSDETGSLTADDIINAAPESGAGFDQFPAGLDTAEIMFTSGTTGKPKGVRLSHSNQMGAAANINTFIGTTSSDVELLALPLSHSFGLGRLRCVLSVGGTLILVDGFGRAKRIFRAFEEHGVTGFSLVPAAWQVLHSLTKDYITRYTDQLRYVELGSAPMAVDAKSTLMACLPKTRICMHYGLTEASRAAFMEFHEDHHALDSVGRASPNVRISILDADGVEMGPLEEGEICVEGPMVFESYWQNDELTATSFRECMFRTGDRGYLDENGFLYLIGRETEMINVGGRKVAPQEIEEQIKLMDGIADCACIGVPDEMAGETVKAFIVAGNNAPDEQQILEALKPSLEPFMIPNEIQWIEALPRTPSGKVQRLALKAAQ